MKRSHTLRTLGAALGSLGLLLCASTALAAEDHGADDNSAAAQGLGNHQKNLRLDIGARTQFVKSAGLDPFSKDDVIGQLSLQASFAFWAQDALSLAVVGGFDYGGSSANARSDEASLDLRRFILAPEVRYHLFRVVALTAKVGPTITREAVEVSGGLGTPMSKTAWKMGFDATAGAAVELWGYANGDSHKPRLWLLGEGGYGWTAPMQLDLHPSASGAAPQRLTPLTLDELSLAGPLFRVTVGLSFW
jgi:hypothetical protein